MKLKIPNNISIMNELYFLWVTTSNILFFRRSLDRVLPRRDMEKSRRTSGHTHTSVGEYKLSLTKYDVCRTRH